MQWFEKTKNKGYTLVEVVVVIAILAVVGGSFLSFSGMLPRSQINKSMEDLIYNIEKTRTDALSYKDARIEIYVGAEGVYVDRLVDRNGNGAIEAGERETSLLGNSSGDIQIKLGGGSYEALTQRLSIGFNRSSGGFTYPSLDGAQQTEYCTGIKLSKGSFVREIELVPLTGKLVY